MTPVQLIRKMRALLAKPESWARRARARDRQGNVVGAMDPDACSWCLSGAIEKVTDGLPHLYMQARRFFENERGWISDEHACLPGFNDATNRTHAEVLDLLDRAIAKAEAA